MWETSQGPGDRRRRDRRPPVIIVPGANRLLFVLFALLIGLALGLAAG